MKQIPTSESDQIEFKTSFNEDVIVSLVAFANTKGGSVYVGIADNGKIIGVTLSAESVQQWVNSIKSKTVPSLMPDVEVLEINGKQIVAIRIIEYPVKPLSVQGKYYRRIQNSNHLMSASEVSDCYMQSMQYSWDSYLHTGSSIKDLDPLRIRKFINRLNEKGRINLDGSDIEILQKLKLIKDNKPTNAAILLFAKDPLMYDVHAGRLKTPDMILDDRIIRNTLFEAVDETMRYIISHLKVAYEISDETVRTTTQRTEIFEYPLDALRELVLNAIIHRKYNSTVDIQIKIFDNKITIFNPGGLYGNITIEDLNRDDYQASARNKLIVEAFYLTGDIEKYGTGYQRIRKAVANYPTMKFIYRETQGGYIAELTYEQQKNKQNKIEDIGEDDGLTIKDIEKGKKRARKGQEREQEREQEKEQEREQEISTYIIKLVEKMEDKSWSVTNLMAVLNLTSRRNFLYTYLYPAIRSGFVSMLYPENPTHRNQKYYLTTKAKKIYFSK
ncbi:MAG: hypothetical protein AUK44_00560 [Porphyromonadaceae bacterium CG2_30_38_12]|nr:MAG: hypothetical protein AUK44_00560 [Porphyromonadaceae bacterium CG2_30_38_12]